MQHKLQTLKIKEAVSKMKNLLKFSEIGKTDYALALFYLDEIERAANVAYYTSNDEE